MRLRTLSYFLSLTFLFLACNNEQSSDENRKFEDKGDLLIKASEIDRIEYKEYVLSKEAESLVIGWTGFQELASQVEFLKTADLTFFKSAPLGIKETFETVRKSIPDELDTNPIKSRLTVIETKFLKLQNDLTLDNISKEDQMETIKGVLISWSNMILVINKYLEFESNEVSRPE